MSFAISIAFSNPSQGMIDTTGPKISSCAIRIFGLTSANTVEAYKYGWFVAPTVFADVDPHLRIDIGKHRGRDEPSILVRFAVETMAAAQHLRAFALADLDVLQIGFQL